MLIKYFFILSLIFTLTESATLRYTDKFIYSILPPFLSEFRKGITAEQLSSAKEVVKNINDTNEINGHEFNSKLQNLLTKLDEKSPVVAKRTDIMFQELIARYSEFSDEANEFTNDYIKKVMGLSYIKDDAKIAEILRELVEKWQKLCEPAKEQIKKRYPNVANNLNDKEFHKFIGFEEKKKCKSTA